jgi:hypothetical protein
MARETRVAPRGVTRSFRFKDLRVFDDWRIRSYVSGCVTRVYGSLTSESMLEGSLSADEATTYDATGVLQRQRIYDRTCVCGGA